jgi:hypothetical protein
VSSAAIILYVASQRVLVVFVVVYSDGFCGGGQSLIWTVEPRKERMKEEFVIMGVPTRVYPKVSGLSR